MPEMQMKMAEMLCTRLCHDLTGPIGAVSNGAEFISEDSFNMQGEAIELIVSSAFSAVSRLQFYRFAYGRVKDQGEASLDDKKQMVEDFFRGTNVALDWPDQHADAANVSVSSRMARLLFNLLVIAAAGLLKGGNIAVRISENENHAKTVMVEATGEAMKWDAEFEAILMGSATQEEMSPRTVQVYLTKLLSQELGVSFEMSHDDSKISIKAVQANPEFSVPEIVQDGEHYG